MSSAPQYEFTQEQNTLVGSLASTMRFVGAFSVAFGVIELLNGKTVPDVAGAQEPR